MLGKKRREGDASEMLKRWWDRRGGREMLSLSMGRERGWEEGAGEGATGIAHILVMGPMYATKSRILTAIAEWVKKPGPGGRGLGGWKRRGEG